MSEYDAPIPDDELTPPDDGPHWIRDPESLLRSGDFQEHGTPEQIAALYGAIAAASLTFEPIETTREVKIDMKGGGAYKYRYAEMGPILDATRPSLAREGVATLFPSTRLEAGGECSLRMLVAHKDGGRLAALFVFDFGGDIKDFGSRLSYLQRYVYSKFYNLATDSDADDEPTRGNEGGATSTPKPRRDAPAPQQRQQAPRQEQPPPRAQQAAQPRQEAPRPQPQPSPAPAAQQPAPAAQAPASPPPQAAPQQPPAASSGVPAVVEHHPAAPADLIAMDEGALVTHLRGMAIHLSYNREIMATKFVQWFGEGKTELKSLSRAERERAAMIMSGELAAKVPA